ncbi:MAG: cyanophycinase [Bryobacteraceae bacterium]|nr:cyanophycinase [Bryobacteraceae bacterium]
MAASSLLLLACLAADADYTYQRAGQAADAVTTVQGGAVLMGGGRDVDEAFSWMIERSGHGDFLVLRATGTNAYNPYVLERGPANSAATLILRNREAASDAFVLERVRQAEAIFLAGGDQWNYVRLWKDTPLATLLNERIAQGVLIGGTSAGLAVLGEHYFSAERDTVTSAQALANPFDEHVTLGTGFLRVPHLEGLITDSHFMQRGREGRLLAFLARLRVRGVGIDEATAVLVNPDGKSRVVGRNQAHFYEISGPGLVCTPGETLDIGSVKIYRSGAGGTFDFAAWASSDEAEFLSVKAGAILKSERP